MAYYKEGPDYSLYTMGPSWVVPVDAVQFVAHLQAHLENLPTRRTLSLCHRFGRGHHVHITKLPKELLDMIAEESDQISRSAFLDIQSEAYRCFAETCEQGDHLGCSCTLPRVEEQPCLEHRRALEIVASETHKTLAKEWCADVRSITERGPFQMVCTHRRRSVVWF